MNCHHLFAKIPKSFPPNTLGWYQNNMFSFSIRSFAEKMRSQMHKAQQQIHASDSHNTSWTSASTLGFPASPQSTHTFNFLQLPGWLVLLMFMRLKWPCKTFVFCPLIPVVWGVMSESVQFLDQSTPYTWFVCVCSCLCVTLPIQCLFMSCVFDDPCHSWRHSQTLWCLRNSSQDSRFKN